MLGNVAFESDDCGLLVRRRGTVVGDVEGVEGVDEWWTESRGEERQLDGVHVDEVKRGTGAEQMDAQDLFQRPRPESRMAE